MSDKLNLIETIANQDKFSTFTRLMASSGTNSVFDDGGEFTVFVPTNDAFAKIPERKINELLNEANQTKLKSLLSYHILSGRVMAAHLPGTPTRRAFSGDELSFSDSNGLKINGASVQARNIEATNGVVHAVDAVLEPFSNPARASASGTTTMARSAVVAAFQSRRSTTLTPVGAATAVAAPSANGSNETAETPLDTKRVS